jgi:drug/metabolite transporter superfamily protein YnfA
MLCRRYAKGPDRSRNTMRDWRCERHGLLHIPRPVRPIHDNRSRDGNYGILVMTPVFLVVALPIELLALFAIWNWSQRERPAGWLILGCVMLSCVAGLAMTLPASLAARLCLGLAGMYLFSTPAWAWWAAGTRPTHWKFGDVGRACLATALFALANAG